VWSNPRPGEDEVRRYYSREYRINYKGHATPSRRHTARSARGALNRYRNLAPFLKPQDRLLDVGAGGGEVVYVLRRRGFDARGIEPDEQYARYAREQLQVPVDTGFVQDVAFPPGSFDVITMYHALEHVENPSGILDTLRTWLTEDGLLVIEVPNVEARCIAPAHRFHFAHFYNFNRETLEALGRKTGYDVVHTSTSPDAGNLITVFRRVPAGRPVTGLDGNFARITGRLAAQTSATYYLSPAPYVGAVGRLRAYVTDTSAAQGAATAKDVIDRLLDRERH
jgi:2-polyprenyl-3-methyl-5-hydroxy-6-metoxy-1,4-benzoquinol methylase